MSFVNVPSFVLHGGLNVKLASRQIRVDVAFGGAFYAIVDSEAVGLPIDAAHLPDLRRVGMEIKDAIESVHDITHPLERGLQGIYGTIFTGPPSDEGADLRNVTVFADAEVDRSPCGTGTAAVMAVVDAMGLLSDTKPFVHESLIGTRFTGRVSARTIVGELEAIVPEIEGSAWITGEHTFLVDDDDPLKNGFRIERRPGLPEQRERRISASPADRLAVLAVIRSGRGRRRSPADRRSPRARSKIGSGMRGSRVNRMP